MELLKTEFVAGKPPTLQVDGEIDLFTAEHLKTALNEAFAIDPKTVVDMAGVTFFDAAGLRVVLQIAGGRNGDGPLILLNAPRVARVLEVVGMSDLTSIVLRDSGELCDR